MVRRGDDARARLVEEAERLFAERGISAVSLRDVSAAAGQRNHSAAQYHYGSRAGLVAAVFEARMRLVNERRLLRLATIDSDGRGDEIHALVAALVEPLVAVIAETGGWYGRFLARVRFDPFASEVVEGLPVADAVRETNRRLHLALAGLPAPVRHGRIEKLNTLLIGTVAAWEWARDQGRPRLDAQLTGDELVATGVAVLTAPQLSSADPDTRLVPAIPGATR
jgi:AcrR family transcriptional regulator